MALPSTPTPIWMRVINDTPKSFAAFTLYREMPPDDRSLLKVAEALGLSRQFIERWSRKHRWVARVQAFDDYQSAVRTRIFQDKQRRSIEKQAELGQRMREKASDGLEFLEPSEFEVSDVCRLAETGVKIERLAYGNTTDQPGPQELRFTMASPPAWADARVRAEEERSAGASIPADPYARPLKASTILELEKSNAAG